MSTFGWTLFAICLLMWLGGLLVLATSFRRNELTVVRKRLIALGIILLATVLFAGGKYIGVRTPNQDQSPEKVSAPIPPASIQRTPKDTSGWVKVVVVLIGTGVVIHQVRNKSNNSKKSGERAVEAGTQGKLPDLTSVLTGTLPSFGNGIAASWKWLYAKKAMAATISAVITILVILWITATPLFEALVRAHAWWGLVIGLILISAFLIPASGKASGVAKFTMAVLLVALLALTVEPLMGILRKTGYDQPIHIAKASVARLDNAMVSKPSIPKRPEEREWKLHWEKSQGVKGLKPGLREDSYSARIIKDDGVVTRIDMSFLHRGSVVHAYMNWDRSENSECGTWSQKDPEDHGTWKGKWVTRDLFSGSFTNKFGEVINMDITPAE